MVEAEGGFAGRGVLKQVTTRETINSTMFTAGDFAIAVEWFDRTDEENGLSFEKWEDTEGDASVQDIINSTELRAASSTVFENGLHFTMAQRPRAIQPVFVARTPRVTRSGTSAAVVDLATTEEPVDAIFDMTPAVDEQIRRGCWMGANQQM